MANPTDDLVLSSQETASHQSDNFFSPDMSMVLLTWITFFLLLAVLYKYAWKPILNALEAREQSIRKSMEDVDHIRVEMERIEKKCDQLIADAEKRSTDIIEKSRKAARDTAEIIEQNAKEEAKITLENVLRDIKEESQKAQTRLREESAHIAVELAAKLIEENMNTDKNRKLINRFIKDI